MALCYTFHSPSLFLISISLTHFHLVQNGVLLLASLLYKTHLHLRLFGARLPGNSAPHTIGFIGPKGQGAPQSDGWKSCPATRFAEQLFIQSNHSRRDKRQTKTTRLMFHAARCYGDRSRGSGSVAPIFSF